MEEYNEPNLILADSARFVKQFLVPVEFRQRSFLGYWHKLCRYLEYKTNRLICKGEPLDPKGIRNILGISQAVTYRFLKEGENQGYLAKMDGCYYFNPGYVMNGTGVRPALAKLFSQSTVFRDRLTEIDQLIINEHDDTNN